MTEPRLRTTRILLPLILFFFTLAADAQNFGSPLDVLIKETNARTAALGGVNVSLMDDDVQMISGNPALANGKMAKVLGMTYNPSLNGIRQYNTAYCDTLSIIGKDGASVFGNLQYLDFGNFTMTDPAGLPMGSFTANQYCASLGMAAKKGSFRLGAALKFTNFQINGLNSSAVCTDLGVAYQHPEKELTFGLSLRNLGFQVKKFYSDGQPMPVPLNLQTGFSYRLSHMPLRISASAFYLQQPDIQYLDPNDPGKLDITGKLVKDKKKITEQIARHLCLGGEFLLSKAFNIRIGYNHLRRKELKTETGSGLTGYSLGFVINTRPLNVAYSWTGWQRGLGLHYLSLNLRISNFYRKQ